MHNKIFKMQFGKTVPNIISSTNNIKLISPSADLGKMKAIIAAKNVNKSGGGVSNMSGGLQAGLGAVSSILGSLSGGNLTAEQSTIREGIRSAISSAGPIGAIIGAASGVVDTIGAATGLNQDNLDKNAAARAGASGAASAASLVNSLPAVSTLVGMFGGKTKQGYKSSESESLSGAFSGSSQDMDAALALSNKRTLFGRRKINRFIDNANRKNKLITEIGIENKLSSQNTIGNIIDSQNLNLYNGWRPQLSLAKSGMKFPELEAAKEIINRFKKAELLKNTDDRSGLIDETQKFQLGGKMNLIPDGALHARKHNLENENPELEGQITTKGIPVVSEYNGEIIQHAEIERDEWTLRKEFTEELELLYKLYQENESDEVAIKAGKLICYELLKNTDDRSGLIDEIK